MTAAVPAEAGPSSDQWWLSQWKAKQSIWPLSRGEGVTVALLDTGVNAQLPDLRGVVLPGGDTLENKSDGLKDLDPAQHGTGMAALIAAQGRETGTMGVAPGARVLSIRANNNTGLATRDDMMAKAIRSAVDQGAKVINMSMGVETQAGRQCDPARQAAVDHAMKHDVIIVAAVGNDGPGSAPSQPASCPGVLAVGAVTNGNRPADFSESGPHVAVAAPGAPVGTLNSSTAFPEGDVKSHDGGTSHAAAITSGVVALVRAKFPRMPAQEVIRRITATARDIGSPGWDDRTGHGVIDPRAALTNRIKPNEPNPVYTRWQASVKQRMTTAARHDETSNAPRTGPPQWILAGVGLAVIFGIIFAGVVVTLWFRRGQAGSGKKL